ncbi:MAG TPA: carbohydrate kinase [Actinocrinis sp.]
MIFVSGENVADLVPVGGGLLRATLGGGPANTAVAAARLGASVSFAGRFGADAFGREFRARLIAAGVDLRHAADVPAPSVLACAEIDDTGAARYDFWLDGAADFAATELPTTGSGDIRHIGSLAAFWPPGADVAARWIDRVRGTVTLDVNLRPIVLASQPDAVERLGRLVSRSHLVKASDEDLQLAYPGVEPERTARRWLEDAGDFPSLVVITLGAQGVVGLTRDGRRVHAPAPKVDVVDTIGAGDAAMGALLHQLASTSLAAVCENLEETLRFTAVCAALACTKPGANPPSKREVEAYIRRLDG